jgi:lipoate---protein ligase
MQFLDLTLKTPAENLACEEALLELCEEGLSGEILRFWESPVPFAVLGYSNKAEVELHLAACAKDGLPVLRRPSGGGTVLQGPGCLNYSLILNIPEKGPLTNLQETNCYVLSQHRQALLPLLGNQVQVQGVSDLTLGPLKFSGNAQRRKRKALLFHGTFLIDFDLEQIQKYVQFPSRHPEYRAKRSHKDFVVNIKLAPEKIKESLKTIWKAEKILKEVPRQKIEDLIQEKYSQESWNLKF